MAAAPGGPAAGERLSSLSVADLLLRVERMVGPTSDAALGTMLVAAERMVTGWHDELAAVDDAWLRYERASGVEERTRRSLTTLLRTMVDLAGVPVATAATAAQVVPPGAESADLAACLLGPFRLFRRGHVVDGWHGNKTPRVLRYLLAQRGRIVPRDVLIDLFWPDASPEAGRRNLHQTIYIVRKVLRGESIDGPLPDRGDAQHILYENDAYAINTAAGFWCDVVEFEAHAANGRRAESDGRTDTAGAEYSSALELYRGDFLDDLPYDEWALGERGHLRMLYLDTVNRLAELRLAAGAVQEALELSHCALAADRCDEAAHRRAMRCYSTSGNRGLMMRQYEACVDAMQQMLGVEPARETIDLHITLSGGRGN